MGQEITRRSGSIEVICGSMFSGKTESLIQRLSALGSAGKAYKVFKPKLDTRYAEDAIVSHSGRSLRAFGITEPQEVFALCSDVGVVAFDEAQFFSDQLLAVCTKLASEGFRVIVAGLERDYLNRPFGCMDQLIVEADHVDKLQARCEFCGAGASFTFRRTHESEKIVLGAREHYVALCRACYYENMTSNKGKQ